MKQKAILIAILFSIFSICAYAGGPMWKGHGPGPSPRHYDDRHHGHQHGGHQGDWHSFFKFEGFKIIDSAVNDAIYDRRYYSQPAVVYERQPEIVIVEKEPAKKENVIVKEEKIVNPDGTVTTTITTTTTTTYPSK